MRTSLRLLPLLAVFASSRALAAEPPEAKPTAPAATVPATPPPAQTAAPPATSTSAPAPAPPSPEAASEAIRQVDLAKQALKAKRFSQGAQLFEAAAALGKQASAHVSAGLAWEQAERPERAADAFARALLSAGEPDASSKDRLDTLERSLGTVDIKAPPGWTVQLDSGTEATAPARLHGAGGIHSLAISAPDHPIMRRDVRLELGKPLALTLKDEPPPTADKQKETAPPPTAPQPDAAVAEKARPVHVRHALGFTAIGLGAASLGGTILLGLETIHARDAFNDAPSRALYDHEQTLRTWTNVTLVAGAVLVLGGVALVLWPFGSSKGEVTVGVAPSPGGGSIVGTF